MFSIVFLNSAGFGKSNMPSHPIGEKFHYFLARLQESGAILVYLKAAHQYLYLDQEFQRWYKPPDLSVKSIPNLKSKILKPPHLSVGSI